jgi:hypothetical protein
MGLNIKGGQITGSNIHGEWYKQPKTSAIKAFNISIQGEMTNRSQAAFDFNLYAQANVFKSICSDLQFNFGYKEDLFTVGAGNKFCSLSAALGDGNDVTRMDPTAGEGNWTFIDGGNGQDSVQFTKKFDASQGWQAEYLLPNTPNNPYGAPLTILTRPTDGSVINLFSTEVIQSNGQTFKGPNAMQNFATWINNL